MTLVPLAPEHVEALLRIKDRADAGIISPLEAAIEQGEVLLAVNPNPHVRLLLEALKDFIDGDDTALNEMLGYQIR